MGESLFRAFDGYLAATGRSVRNTHFRARWLFEAVDLRGAQVLDVGAGIGLLSMYAACAGAAKVVSLEPEGPGSGAGSRPPARQAYDEAAAHLGVAARTELVPCTLQAYEHDGDPFDVLLLHASLNHLDEPACMRLQEDAAAREAYRRIFEKLARLGRPGAILIATDCARRNLFGDLHLPNPLAPSIDWRKHQQPQLWAELLTECGFGNARIRWSTPSTLRRAGRLVLSHRAAAYCLRSGFCLTIERLSTPGRAPRAAALAALT
jgi:SAM-dependent methyltransferase